MKNFKSLIALAALALSFTAVNAHAFQVNESPLGATIDATGHIAVTMYAHPDVQTAAAIVVSLRRPQTDAFGVLLIAADDNRLDLPEMTLYSRASVASTLEAHGRWVFVTTINAAGKPLQSAAFFVK